MVMVKMVTVMVTVISRSGRTRWKEEEEVKVEERGG